MIWIAISIAAIIAAFRLIMWQQDFNHIPTNK
jgi:hypothetical protein